MRAARLIAPFRRTILPLVLAIATHAPASAQGLAFAEGLYLQGFGGLSRLDTPRITDGGTQSPIFFQTGALVGAAAGYDFGAFRFEGEIAYRTHDADRLLDIMGEPAAARAESSVLTLMANAYLDFDLGGSTTPYVGVGLGVARIDLYVNDLFITLMDDSDWAFAAQAMAGVGTFVAPGVELFLEARVLTVDTSDLYNPPNANIPGPFVLPALTVANDYVTYDGIVGLRWHLGGSSAAPPDLPPPHAHVDGGGQQALTVAFQNGSADLSVEANSVLDGAVVLLEANGFVRLAVSAGPDGAALFDRRLDAVRQGLVVRGVAPDEIVVRSFGQAAGSTAGGIADPAGRRVEIVAI